MLFFSAETSVTPLVTKGVDTESRGRWQTWVHCTQVPEDVPDIQVVVFGRKGKSPAQKVQNLDDNPFLVSSFWISHKSYLEASKKWELWPTFVKLCGMVFCLLELAFLPPCPKQTALGANASLREVLSSKCQVWRERSLSWNSDW